MSSELILNLALTLLTLVAVACGLVVVHTLLRDIGVDVVAHFKEGWHRHGD